MKKLIALLLIALSFSSFAIDTKVIVRAKAKDAKFIGSSIGGAYVIIRNTLNNEILAEGLTSGSTGNTDLIMKTAKERKMMISDEKTAAFTATIDIDQPTFVSVEVIAPVNSKDARVQSTTELWLIPGKHILGDGIVVEIPGFVVDILNPRTHLTYSLESLKSDPMILRANVVMMCGCPIESGGLWNADEMEVKAIVNKDGKFLKEVTMTAESTNLFSTKMEFAEGGNFEVMVYAYNPTTGNTGLDKVNFMVK